MINLASKTKKILRRLSTIRLVVPPAPGFGDQSATIRIITWLRAAGYGGWIELIVYEKARFKIEELLNLPHNLPNTFVIEEMKIMIIAMEDFLLHRQRGEIDLINYGISGAHFTDVENIGYRYANYAEIFCTKAFLVMSPYRFHSKSDKNKPHDTKIAQKFLANKIYIAGKQEVYFQTESIQYVVWDKISKLEEALDFLKTTPGKIGIWATDFIKQIQNDKIYVMPIYGLLRNSEDVFPFTMAKIICGIKAAQNIDNSKLNTKPVVLFLPQAISTHMLQKLQELLTNLRDSELTKYSIPIITIITRKQLRKDGIESITNAKPGEIFIFITDKLPKFLFDAIYFCPQTNILPPVYEGANSANGLALKGKLSLHCSNPLERKKESWDEMVDLSKAPPEVKHLEMVHKQLCQEQTQFKTGLDNELLDVIGNIINDSFNPDSKLNDFFREFRKLVTTKDKLAIGLNYMLTRNLAGNLNSLLGLEKSIMLGNIATIQYYFERNFPIPTMIVDGKFFHPTPFYCIIKGQFAILNKLIRLGIGTKLSIEEKLIPDNLKFFYLNNNYDFLNEINQYYNELIQYTSIDSIKHGGISAEKLNLLLKFAIAFDIKEKIEPIMRLNPDLTIVHHHYSVLSIALATNNLELISKFLKNKVPITAIDLELAAKYTDISMFISILKYINSKEWDIAKVLVNTIIGDNIAIFKFLSSQYPEDTKRVLSRSSLYPIYGYLHHQISFGMSNEIVNFLAANNCTYHVYSSLLAACYGTHIPNQLQILFEKITTNHHDRAESIILGSLHDLLLSPGHLKYFAEKFPAIFTLNTTINIMYEYLVAGKILYNSIEPIFGKNIFANVAPDFYLAHNISKLQLPVLTPQLIPTSESTSHDLNLRCWVSLDDNLYEINIPPNDLCNNNPLALQPISYCSLRDAGSVLTKYGHDGFTNDYNMGTFFIDFSKLNGQCKKTMSSLFCNVKAGDFKMHVYVTSFTIKLPSSDQYSLTNCILHNHNEILLSGNNSFLYIYTYNNRALFFTAFIHGLKDGLLSSGLYKVGEMVTQRLKLSKIKNEIIRDFFYNVGTTLILINNPLLLITSNSYLATKWLTTYFFPKHTKDIQKIFPLIHGVFYFCNEVIALDRKNYTSYEQLLIFSGKFIGYCSGFCLVTWLLSKLANPMMAVINKTKTVINQALGSSGFFAKILGQKKPAGDTQHYELQQVKNLL